MRESILPTSSISTHLVAMLRMAEKLYWAMRSTPEPRYIIQDWTANPWNMTMVTDLIIFIT